jgi:hypothetical protein
MLLTDIRYLIFRYMDKALLELGNEVIKWIGTDSRKRKALIKKAPISQHTLRQIEAGRYVPGDQLANALRWAMAQIDRTLPKQQDPEEPPPKAA